MDAKNPIRRQVQKTRFVINFMRKLASCETKQTKKKSLTKTLWKNFWIEVPLSLCLFPLMRLGLADFLTNLSFKEDHTVSQQQQNLLFFNWKWTIWMVCNLQGRESYLGWGWIDFGVFQRGAKKGERGFCPKGENQDPKNPEEVAWPNATEVSCENSIFWNRRGGVFATSHARVPKRALKTDYER